MIKMSKTLNEVGKKSKEFELSALSRKKTLVDKEKEIIELLEDVFKLIDEEKYEKASDKRRELVGKINACFSEWQDMLKEFKKLKKELTQITNKSIEDLKKECEGVTDGDIMVFIEEIESKLNYITSTEKRIGSSINLFQNYLKNVDLKLKQLRLRQLCPK